MSITKKKDVHYINPQITQLPYSGFDIRGTSYNLQKKIHNKPKQGSISNPISKQKINIWT